MRGSARNHPFSRRILSGSPRRIAPRLAIRRVWPELMSIVTEWRRQMLRRPKYQNVSGLDEAVLEQIGLARCQVRYDACHPVWWQ